MSDARRPKRGKSPIPNANELRICTRKTRAHLEMVCVCVCAPNNIKWKSFWRFVKAVADVTLRYGCVLRWLSSQQTMKVHKRNEYFVIQQKFHFNFNKTFEKNPKKIKVNRLILWNGCRYIYGTGSNKSAIDRSVPRRFVNSFFAVSSVLFVSRIVRQRAAFGSLWLNNRKRKVINR